MKVAPGIGILVAIVCILFNENPPRGKAESSTDVVDSWQGFQATSWIADIKAILKT